MRVRGYTVAIILLLAAVADAQVIGINRMRGDHMVLNAPLDVIQGTAAPGSTVQLFYPCFRDGTWDATCPFAPYAATPDVVGANGAWAVMLPVQALHTTNNNPPIVSSLLKIQITGPDGASVSSCTALAANPLSSHLVIDASIHNTTDCFISIDDVVGGVNIFTIGHSNLTNTNSGNGNQALTTWDPNNTSNIINKSDQYPWVRTMRAPVTDEAETDWGHWETAGNIVVNTKAYGIALQVSETAHVPVGLVSAARIGAHGCPWRYLSNAACQDPDQVVAGVVKQLSPGQQWRCRYGTDYLDAVGGSPRSPADQGCTDPQNPCWATIHTEGTNITYLNTLYPLWPSTFLTGFYWGGGDGCQNFYDKWPHVFRGLSASWNLERRNIFATASPVDVTALPNVPVTIFTWQQGASIEHSYMNVPLGTAGVRNFRSTPPNANALIGSNLEATNIFGRFTSRFGNTTGSVFGTPPVDLPGVRGSYDPPIYTVPTQDLRSTECMGHACDPYNVTARIADTIMADILAQQMPGLGDIFENAAPSGPKVIAIATESGNRLRVFFRHGTANQLLYFWAGNASGEGFHAFYCTDQDGAGGGSAPPATGWQQAAFEFVGADQGLITCPQATPKHVRYGGIDVDLQKRVWDNIGNNDGLLMEEWNADFITEGPVETPAPSVSPTTSNTPGGATPTPTPTPTVTPTGTPTPTTGPQSVCRSTIRNFMSTRFGRAHWPMDDTAPTITMTDIGPTESSLAPGMEGAYVNAPTLQEPPVIYDPSFGSTSVLFNSALNQAGVGNALSYVQGTDLVAVIFVQNISNHYQVLLSYGDMLNNPDSVVWRLDQLSTGTTQFTILTNPDPDTGVCGATSTIENPTVINDGQPHMLIITYSGLLQQQFLYVSDVSGTTEVHSTTGNGTICTDIDTTGSRVTIGEALDGTSAADGRIDEPFILGQVPPSPAIAVEALRLACFQVAVTPTPSPARCIPVCIGDCSGTNHVTQANVDLCIQIANGFQPRSACPQCDGNGDGTVDGTDIAAAQANAQNGCPGEQSPTPTATRTASITNTPGATATPSPTRTRTRTPTPAFTGISCNPVLTPNPCNTAGPSDTGESCQLRPTDTSTITATPTLTPTLTPTVTP